MSVNAVMDIGEENGVDTNIINQDVIDVRDAKKDFIDFNDVADVEYISDVEWSDGCETFGDSKHI
ncbi:MAG: hypothetical protein ACP5KG_12015 [Myxococcota bacterium]